MEFKGFYAQFPTVLESSTVGGLNKIGGIDITTHQGTQFGNLGKNKEFDVSIPRDGQFDRLGRSTENKGFARTDSLRSSI